jgi:hypothetical protein
MKIKALAAHNGQAHHAKNHHECPMPALRKVNPAALLGSRSTPAKAKAARKNAKLGGWPKGRKRGRKNRTN